MKTIVSKSNLSDLEKELVFQLWNEEYPAKICFQSISEFEAYLDNLSEVTHYLLHDELEAIQGWAITFIRENEKWFAIIINSKIQNKGFGTELLSYLKSIEPQLSGWVVDHNNDSKLDGTTYASPLRFYSKNGFSVCHKIKINTEKIVAVKIVWNL